MVLIPEGVGVGENMSLRRSLIRGSTTEVLHRVLDTVVIDDNNRWRNMEKSRGGGKGLNRIGTYTQVENTLGIHLIYLQIL